ncbi:MAG: IS66 family insertion sequence element accessory protein TnpB [Myxococcaceae bacterium]
MIGSTRKLTVLAFTAPTDMRKGYDGLCALVTSKLFADPVCGNLFLFVSRTRKRAKVLFWDGTGLVIYAKRLEKGRFTAPWERQVEGPVEMTVSELGLFLEGSRLAGRMKLSPAAFVVGTVFAPASR